MVYPVCVLRLLRLTLFAWACWQDALFNTLGRHGMVVCFDGKEMIVMRNLKWGLLTWPLVRLDHHHHHRFDRCVMWQLDVSPDSEGCKWYCILSEHAWKAWPVKMAWEDEAGIVIKSLKDLETEPLLLNCLRNSDQTLGFSMI